MVVVYKWEGTQLVFGTRQKTMLFKKGGRWQSHSVLLPSRPFSLRCLGANERAKDGLSGLMGTDGFQKSVIGSVVPTLGAVAISAALAALPIGCCCNLGCSRGVALELVSGQTMVCVWTDRCTVVPSLDEGTHIPTMI